MPGRRAHGGGLVAAIEGHTRGGQFVDVRGLCRPSVELEIEVTTVIRKKEEEVGRCTPLASRARQDGEEHDCKC